MKLRLISTSVLAVVLSLAATSAFAHGGHKHQILGTVKMLQGDRLVVTTTEKSDVTFTLTEKTKLSKGADGATKADLKEGVRVSVYVENDGTTATAIKIAR